VAPCNFGDYGDYWTSIEHMQHSPEFADRTPSLGVDVDPERLIAAREAGAWPWDVYKRAWANEFAPAIPYYHLASL
jgi:catechol 2,3-dioxygenase